MVPWYPELLGYMDVYDVYIYTYTGWWFQPSWKIWVNGKDYIPWLIPYMKWKIKFMFQTTNQYIYMYVCIYVLYTHGKVVFPTIMGISGKQKVDQWGITVSKSIPWHSSRLASYVYSRWWSSPFILLFLQNCWTHDIQSYHAFLGFGWNMVIVWMVYVKHHCWPTKRGGSEPIISRWCKLVVINPLYSLFVMVSSTPHFRSFP